MSDHLSENLEVPTFIRLADGRVYDGPLPVTRHRANHLAALHGQTSGDVEIAAGPRPPGDKVSITTRRQFDHFLPGGAAGSATWMEDLLALVGTHDSAEEEVFVGVTGKVLDRRLTDQQTRSYRRRHKELKDARADMTPLAEELDVTIEQLEPLLYPALKENVHESRWLWVDVDEPARLSDLWAFFETTTVSGRPRVPHIVVDSGGSGGVHAYWHLDQPLAAITRTADDLETHWIERANQRLIYAVGSEIDADSGRHRPTVCDNAAKDRSRVLRLAGTRNFKTGLHARLRFLDLHTPPFDVGDLVGNLDDPKDRVIARRRTPGGGAGVHHEDPYKRLDLADVFFKVTGREVPAHGLASCPRPDHPDRTPSCNVQADVWHCYGCGEGGGVYDLASAAIGGPTGSALRGDAFKRAKEELEIHYGHRNGRR